MENIMPLGSLQTFSEILGYNNNNTRQ